MNIRKNMLFYARLEARESRNINTQSGEIHDRKSKHITFVINAGMNVTADNFYILSPKRNDT